MKELKLIVDSYEKLKSQSISCALVTVVHVEGSSYRRPGARMLVGQDGKLTGAISGGCLEGDALKKSLRVINENKAAIVTYDTMDEDDAVLGIGLGCNGIIKLLIEPIDYNNQFNPVELLKIAFSKRQSSVLTTLFADSISDYQYNGTKLLFHEDGKKTGTFPDEKFLLNLFSEASKVLKDQNSSWLYFEHDGKPVVCFIEYLPPLTKLVIIGGGNDVMPLLEIANLMGWESHIIDGRHNYATHHRFPSACSVLVAKPEQIMGKISIDEFTVFVLLTHNYNYDKALLHLLAQNEDIRYIGLLGPKKKFDKIITEYSNEGRPLSAKQIEKVFGPVGLDIGAETSEEIAISIVGEIQAIFKNKKGGSLKNIENKIH